MKLVAFKLVLLVILKENVYAAEPRIVGGIPAVQGQFPCQASLRMKSTDFPFCGGCVIDDQHVVTAAHCVFEPYNEHDYRLISPSDLVVKAGGINDNQLKAFDVKNIFTHESYQPSDVSSKGDIAILRIFGNFSDYDHIEPAVLATEEKPAGTKCFVSGRGTTSVNGPTSPVLLYTIVYITDHNTCKSIYSTFGISITDNNICAGDLTSNHDSCQGDSGGPLNCDKEFMGVVSYGIGCGDPLYPGVYTSIPYYISWINKTLLASSATNLYNKIYLYIILMIITTLLKL